MIPVGPAERPALERFLRAHLLDAMFPLANLAAHGLHGAHPNATRFWVDAPDPTAALGLTRRGMALPVWDAGFDATRAVPLLGDAPVTGLAGAAHVVRPLMRAANLDRRPALLSDDEPQYALDLDSLAVPPGAGRLVPISRDPATAAAWRLAYERELHLGHGDPAGAEATVRRWTAEDSHRILVVDGAPVALTGFNARLPDIVQVGSVFVPPALRRRGLGALAVAQHLAEARAAGVRRATLFAASPAAASVYERLGFHRAGTFALALLEPEAAA
ncbi:GNAT family N-acetyltransferase [Jannaschia sp. W003]|uniref:GNAT family N-acetyltransferase n=1 Tax=Jannaschia sp. W003 TaxID=2867012 RepID=UPI0021A52027|nr:GNAT family N-acetyltransferase [Jannaschia sp. W003]UWQ22719.1 GNAT family N-acetyltransferase [Jannaschia sp. W003]